MSPFELVLALLIGIPILAIVRSDEPSNGLKAAALAGGLALALVWGLVATWWAKKERASGGERSGDP